MNSKGIIVIVGLILGGLLVAGIISTMVIERSSNNDSCCEENNTTTCIEPCITDVCPTNTCQEQVCLNNPEISTFIHCQTLNNVAAGASPEYGKNFVVAGGYLFVADEITTDSVVQSKISVYVNNGQSNIACCANYVFAYTFIQDGHNPILAENAGMIYVASTTLEESQERGLLVQYSYNTTSYEVQYTSTITTPPKQISAYNSIVALLSDETVYLYSNGVINYTFANLGIKSASISGNSSYTYLLLGSSGKAYLYCKSGNNPAGAWGEPMKTYLGQSTSFGEFVEISLPIMVIGSSDKIYVYDSSNIETPQTCVLFDSGVPTTPSISGCNVLLSTSNKVQYYSRNKCEEWNETYIFNFPSATWTTAKGFGNSVLISNGDDVTSQIESYERTYQ